MIIAIICSKDKSSNQVCLSMVEIEEDKYILLSTKNVTCLKKRDLYNLGSSVLNELSERYSVESLEIDLTLNGYHSTGKKSYDLRRMKNHVVVHEGSEKLEVHYFERFCDAKLPIKELEILYRGLGGE